MYKVFLNILFELTSISVRICVSLGLIANLSIILKVSTHVLTDVSEVKRTRRLCFEILSELESMDKSSVSTYSQLDNIFVPSAAKDII